MQKLTPKQSNGLDSFKSGFKSPGKRKKFAIGGSVGRVVGSVLRPAPSPTARQAASQPGNRMIQKYADGGKVMGPATAEGKPIGYGDIADVTVNTAKGIGRAMLKTLKGDSKGADDDLSKTREENREISRKAAERYETKRYADGGKVTKLDQETVDNINGSANAMEAAEEAKKKSAGRQIPRVEVTAKRMTPAEAKAYDDAQVQRHEIHRTINGAPIRNLHPANLPAGSGGVRG